MKRLNKFLEMIADDLPWQIVVGGATLGPVTLIITHELSLLMQVFQQYAVAWLNVHYYQVKHT